MFLQLAFPYDWNWKTSLLLGAILSATDPVAVVALLKDLGASKKLSTIVEGESMMNDGYKHKSIFLSFLRENPLGFPYNFIFMSTFLDGQFFHIKVPSAPYSVLQFIFLFCIH